MRRWCIWEWYLTSATKIKKRSSKAHWASSLVMSKYSSLRRMSPIQSSPAYNLDWRRNLSNLPPRKMSRLLLPSWKLRTHLLRRINQKLIPLLKSLKPKLKLYHQLKMIKRSQSNLKLRNQWPKTAFNPFNSPKISRWSHLLSRKIKFQLKFKILNKIILQINQKFHIS